MSFMGRTWLALSTGSLVEVTFIGAMTTWLIEVLGQVGKGWEWNYVQFRPNGRGLRQEGGFLRASIDPEAGYEEDQVRFGNPLVYSNNG